MDQRITHILVPVDSDDDTRAAQLAAMRLAAGDGAMVTLLYVHDRHARMRSEAGIDSIANLHQVMSASPQDFLMTPVYPDHKKQQSLQHLRETREHLSLRGFDESLIRTAFRCGDATEETAKFIDEAGVDVVLIQSPGSLKSPILRRLARTAEDLPLPTADRSSGSQRARRVS